MQGRQVADVFEQRLTSWLKVERGVVGGHAGDRSERRQARYQSGDTLSPFVRASLLGDPLLAYRACIDRALGTCFQPHTPAPSNESRTKDCRKPLEHLLDSL